MRLSIVKEAGCETHTGFVDERNPISLDQIWFWMLTSKCSSTSKHSDSLSLPTPVPLSRILFVRYVIRTPPRFVFVLSHIYKLLLFCTLSCFSLILSITPPLRGFLCMHSIVWSWKPRSSFSTLLFNYILGMQLFWHLYFHGWSSLKLFEIISCTIPIFISH